MSQPHDLALFTPLLPCDIPENEGVDRASFFERSARRYALFKERRALIALCILLPLLLFALLFPLFSSSAYSEVNLAQKNMAPSFDHIFGTDDLGRDLATRCSLGLRISLAIGFLAALLDLLIGFVWGALSGYMGGVIDLVMMRLAELIYSIPYLLFVIFITSWLPPGALTLLCAMCLIGWIQMARLVRIEVMTHKKQDYVLAAEALGVPPHHIVLKHIMPNILGPVIAMLILSISQAIFTEAFLSFLGIGIQPPQASLGSLVSDGLAALRYYPWRLFFPAGVLSLTILSFHLLADSVKDTFDPQKSLEL